MPACDNRPIGIFDSGLGGLTVARAIAEAFPHEAILYLGDTARLPYGTKSPETVRAYAREDVAFLLTHDVKAVVAACNTVSSAALPDMQGCYDVPLMGVVEVGARAAAGSGRMGERIGVIGTQTTIASGAYDRAIQACDGAARIDAVACPLFVPLIEEGWFECEVTDLTIAKYLSPMRDRGIDALVLGCTHYPLLRGALERFFGPKVRVVDSAEAMADALGEAFDSGRIARGAGGASRYYVTDRCNHFQELVSEFMGRGDLAIEQISSDRLTEALQAYQASR